MEPDPVLLDTPTSPGRLHSPATIAAVYGLSVLGRARVSPEGTRRHRRPARKPSRAGGSRVRHTRAPNQTGSRWMEKLLHGGGSRNPQLQSWPIRCSCPWKSTCPTLAHPAEGRSRCRPSGPHGNTLHASDDPAVPRPDSRRGLPHHLTYRSTHHPVPGPPPEGYGRPRPTPPAFRATRGFPCEGLRESVAICRVVGRGSRVGSDTSPSRELCRGAGDRGKFVGSSNRQRSHYSAMAKQEAARRRAIRALVGLSQFPDDNEAAVRSLRLLEAAPSELADATSREFGLSDPLDKAECSDRW